MSPFSKARTALERWLQSADTSSPNIRDSAGDDAPRARDAIEVDQRVRSFVEGISTHTQDWLGRVRLINFDTVRDRVGPAWHKLHDKIELLAEKIIRDELSDQDSYSKIGEAEFLLFFGDASADEARIRCLTIVETIQEKLFGDNSQIGDSSERFAECHVVHEEDLTMEWNSPDSADIYPDRRTPVDVLRCLFRPDAEVLRGTDLATSAQAVVDTIIRRAAESHNVAELGPLAARTRHLARDLAVLKPALDLEGSAAQPLREAEEDTADLLSVLEVNSGYSHNRKMEALASLRRARAERAAKALATSSSMQSAGRSLQTRQFEYVPVFRSVSGGEHLYRGIYRISFRSTPQLGIDLTDDESADHRYQELAAQERTLLERAIESCADYKAGAEFTLMAPVHVETLRRPNLQRRYSTVLRAGQLRAKRRLVIEVVGYRKADDTISIRRAIEELRVHAHAVFISQSLGNVDNSKFAIEAYKRLGVHAVGLDISEFEGSDAKIASMLGTFVRLAEGASIQTYATGIASTAILAKAVACGVSYVCAPDLVPRDPNPGNFERTTIEELYWPVS